MLKKKQNSNRGERIASTVQKLVAEILRDNYMDDPLLSGVSIVGSESSGGLSFARIYYYVRSKLPPPLEGAVGQRPTGGGSISESEQASPRPASQDTPLQERGELAFVQKRLDFIKPAIRRELAHKMNQRYVPDLHFIYDDTLERSERIDALLANIEK